MILSGGPASATLLPALLAGLALLAYVLAAIPAGGVAAGATALWQRMAGPALAVAVASHALLLLIEILVAAAPGPRLGFGPVLSLTVCLVLAVHAVESRLVPLPGLRRVLALAGAAAVALALTFPGEARPTASSWGPVHWLLGVASYGLFGAAVLHALMLDAAERRLRSRKLGGEVGALGMPLLQLERLTFRFVQAGFGVLSVAIVMGIATSPAWHWNHKTVLSLLAWALFAALLLGRHRHGWRGQRATRWLYAGALILLLAYAGSRFVLEVVLGRGGA